MEFLNDVNAEIDLVHQTVVINGEPVDCFDFYHKLNFRYVVRRSVTIPFNAEVVAPVHLNHRQCLLKGGEACEGPRIIEPRKNTRMQRKSLFIGRTLVTA